MVFRTTPSQTPLFIAHAGSGKTGYSSATASIKQIGTIPTAVIYTILSARYSRQTYSPITELSSLLWQIASQRQR
jgi:hypothetical protein